MERGEADRYEVGDLIKGEYRVLAKERGFLGRVYLCRREAPGPGPDYAAIKTFRFDEEIHRALFDAELKNWVSLSPHPNVVRALDADRVEKLLILEFIHGPNLKFVSKRRPVHPRHFIPWAREIAEGLRFLHVEKHFVHRDLRPANVLVDTRNGLVAKISDLGIGKPLDPEAASHTQIGIFNYMAPEVFEGRTDYRSDIFCYGATLYYLLVGRVAVKRSTQYLTRVVPPSEWVSGVPGEVDDLVVKCLERMPEDRFQSMDEVIAALGAFREWPVHGLPYRHCGRHGFLYFARSTSGCPFCDHARELRRRERNVPRRHRRGSRRER